MTHRSDPRVIRSRRLVLSPALNRMPLKKGIIVNYHRHITIALLLAAIAGAASAQGKTRAEVEAELAAAMRNGDMLIPGELGIRERDLRPDLYPSSSVAGKTTAQAGAELAAAVRHGDLLRADGMRERDVAPGMYPVDPVVAGKTRAQVEGELAMAIRDGDMLAPGESGLTENQLEPRFYAQQRAVDEAARLAALQSTSQMGAAGD
jgi:hypothetical protein